MVSREQRIEFYNLDSGDDSKQIPNTRACLLTLPALENKYQVVASQGPQMSEMVTLWKTLVLDQGATLIVNLCSRVGERWSECDQYWPTEQTGPIVSECEKVSVSLLSFEEVCSTFTISKLRVDYMGLEFK